MPWPEPWPVGWRVLGPRPYGCNKLAPDGLERGDVLLFTASSPNALQSAIVRLQEHVTGGRQHACATHVGIYVGSGIIYDAAPSYGVSGRQLALVQTTGFLRARRLKGASTQEQDAICDAAVALYGSYDYLRAFADSLLMRSASITAWVNKLNRPLMNGTTVRSSYYCSSLVESAYVTGVNVSVQGTEVSALPSTFSMSDQFDEVMISW